MMSQNTVSESSATITSAVDGEICVASVTLKTISALPVETVAVSSEVETAMACNRFSLS
jgi:hypothetical protein